MAGGLGGRHRDGRGGAVGVQAKDPRRGTRRPHGPGRRGHVPAAIEVRRPQTIAEPAGHLRASDNAGHQLLTANPGDLRRRQRSGHDRRARMQEAREIGVVVVLDMRGQSVDESRPRRGEALRAAEHPGITALAQIRGGGQDRFGRCDARSAHGQADDVCGGAPRRDARGLGHVGPAQPRDERGDVRSDVVAHTFSPFARAANHSRPLRASATFRVLSTMSFSRPGMVRSTNASTF